jgi:hypothetical protein
MEDVTHPVSGNVERNFRERGRGPPTVVRQPIGRARGNEVLNPVAWEGRPPLEVKS